MENDVEIERSGGGDKENETPKFPVKLETKSINCLITDEEFCGFDRNAGKNYVYPQSAKYQFREYQYKICQEAFFKNTLIVLPDGLGKSFIASIVMYNIYRWYPTSKIIFLSATKSILKGQMEACWNIMNIPKGDCVEITGKSPGSRLDMWKKHRLIFGTPRQVLSDFRELINLPLSKIKLLVVTEAHKARGNGNPFAQLLEILHEQNSYFRILALTSMLNKKACEIADVIRNLRISHMEIRQENSPDIVEFIKKNRVQPLPVKFAEHFRAIREDFLITTDSHTRSLVLTVHVSGNMGTSRLVAAKKKFLEASQTEKHPKHAEILKSFDICIGVHQALDLLYDYGVVSMLSFMETEFLRESKKSGSEILKEPVSKVKNTFLKCIRLSENDKFEVNEELHEIIVAGHPKIGAVEKVLMEHFQKNTNSHVIIFSNCPKATRLLQNCLCYKCPAMQAERLTKEMSEGERNCVRLKFSRGKINTVITGWIPDDEIVNEADLIICYDTHVRSLKTFIRSRAASNLGKKCLILVVVLEETDAMIALSELWKEKGETPQDIHRNPVILAALSDQSPRLVPVEFNPVNLIPPSSSSKNSVSGGEKSRQGVGRGKKIMDYFKNVPPPSARCLVDSSKALNPNENFNLTTTAPSSVNKPTIVQFLSLPIPVIVERVNALKREKFSHLAKESMENITKIVRGSILTPFTQEFLLDILRQHRSRQQDPERMEKEREFLKFLEEKKNATAISSSSSAHKFNYYSSIVENVAKKLRGESAATFAAAAPARDEFKTDVMSQDEETFFDVSHLNTGFHCTQTQEISPVEEKSICDTETLSFFLLSSLEELFERSDPCGVDVFEMRKPQMNEESSVDDDMKFHREEPHDTNAQNISLPCDVEKMSDDGEHEVEEEEDEVIPCSQVLIPSTHRQRQKYHRTDMRTTTTTTREAHVDGHSGREDECNPGLQLCSISSPDIDNKFNLGTIDSIFTDDGNIFEKLRTPTLPSTSTATAAAAAAFKQDDEEQPTVEFTSPSVLGGRRRRQSQRSSVVGADAARLKHSNNNANDFARETNSTCINPCEGDGSDGIPSEFFSCPETLMESSPTVIPCSQLTAETSFRAPLNPPTTSKAKPHRSRKQRNDFIESQAGVVNDEGDQEDEEETNHYFDSILVDSDDDEQIEQLNMANDIQAKYLQSVRSPPTVRAGFRIPHPDRYRDVVDVFSQTQIPDDSEYINDTFVVDEVEDFNSDLSILEQAEAKLRRRKRPKSTRNHGNKPKRSRIISRPTESSSDPDE